MLRDTKHTSSFIVIMVMILTLSHRTSGGGSWKRLERMFVQQNHGGNHWDENRIIFPDMIEDTKSSWRSTTTPRYDDRRQCESNCHVSREYSPVCGTNGVTYQNMDQLQCAKKCGVAVDFQRHFPCSNGPIITTTSSPFLATTHRNVDVDECIRTCPSTPEYNPVCGSNRVTYNNEGKLRCAKYCGVDVTLWRHSPCPPSPRTSTVAPSTPDPNELEQCLRNCPTTTEYSPVCGTDDVTYYNIGKLECAKLCGVDVSVQRQGPCSVPPNNQQSENSRLTSGEDYGEDIIEIRQHPRDQEYFWN